jgi:hypothetical protein
MLKVIWPHRICPILKTIYIDESGHTGPDLLNPDQPCFSLASLAIDGAIAEEILGCLPPTQKKEYKSTSYLRSPRRLEAAAALFDHPAINVDTCQIYLIDKYFMASAVLVDSLHYEWARAAGHDMHSDGSAASLSHLLHLVSRSLAGEDSHRAMLAAFLAMCRDCNRSTKSAFLGIFYEFYCRIYGKNRDFAVDFWLPVMLHHESFLKDFANGIVYDPVTTALMPTAHAWGDKINGPICFQCDESKVIAKSCEHYKAWSDPSIPSRVVGFGERKATFPLKVQSIVFEDSASKIELQLADLIAGVSRYAFSCQLAGKKNPIADKVMAKILSKGLLLGGFVPSLDAISEHYTLLEPLGINAADFCAEVLANKN